MRLGGHASFLAEVSSDEDLLDCVQFAKQKNLPIRVIGEGSNTIFKDNSFQGLLIVNRILGFALDEAGLLTVGAGENWDDSVSASVEEKWSGIEALSLIPGTVGAAPVQNIGGYGQELADTFVGLRAFDLKQDKFIEMSKDDCNFGYRTSLLKQNPGDYIVTQVTLQLHRENMKPPFYTTLERYFNEHQISEYSPSNIRSAVVNWRSSYLPDVKTTNTVGSFFVNPIVDRATLDAIIDKHPDIASNKTDWYWEQPNGQFKVAAGKLADQAGLKDWHDEKTGMATWKNSAIILVNENATSYQDLAKFREQYLKIIKENYGITFEQEPVEL